MKALVLKDIQKLDYEPDWRLSEYPDDWSLVNVKASGICGSDLPRIMQQGAYHHPMIPGHEFSGTVIKRGAGGVSEGDRVAVLPIIPCQLCDGCRIGPFHCRSYDFIGSRRDGGYAEICPVPRENLFVLPDNITFTEGAFIEPLLVALHAVKRSRLHAGADVLVFGAGAIGILIAQWAQILGARKVNIVDVREESLSIASNCGIQTAVHFNSEAIASVGECEYVFEAAGSNLALQEGIRRITHKGTMVVVGRETQETRLPLPIFESLMRKEIDLRGCWGYTSDNEDRSFLYNNLQEGKLCLSPLVTHIIPFSDGPSVIQKMWQHSFYYCKVQFHTDL